MVRKFFAAACCVLLCAAAALAAGTKDGKYVVVEVAGKGTDRKAAIEDAWLAAIQEAVGTFIDSKTELNDNQLTERIIAYSRGLVDKYEITAQDESTQGVYRVNMRVWVVSDRLRDGVASATAKGATMPFSKADIEARKREELDAMAAKEMESHDSLAKTQEEQAKKGAELLSATLERYKTEDFLVYRIAGKPEPVKGKNEVFSVPIEVTFNEKAYYEKFVPELEKVLDQIAAQKKNTVLMKQKNELRDLKNGKALDGEKANVVLRGAGLGAKFSVAVYDKPDRFGCRLYGFSDAMKGDALKAIDNFQNNIDRVKGFQLELQDEDNESIYTVEQDVALSLLISGNGSGWAFHPTLLSGADTKSESARVTIPFEFEMPVELQELVKSLKASLTLSEPKKLVERIQHKLGFTIDSVPDEVAKKRHFAKPENYVYVSRVVPGGWADNVKLKSGDIITSINHSSFDGLDGFIKTIRDLSGQNVILAVDGAGGFRFIKVTLP